MPQVKDFPKPKGPEVEPMFALHGRVEDGYVRFLKTDEKGIKEALPSILSRDLLNTFPEFREELSVDGYYSVNAFWRPGTHAAKDARYLNACFADLDFGKPTNEEEATLRFGQALKLITDLQDRLVIPPASIIGRSGTGAWLFWLLTDSKDPSRPPRAYPRRQVDFIAIQHELGRAIRDAARELRPDANAIDVSRITRVPGSMHSGAHRRVAYLPQFDGSVPPEVEYEDGMVWLKAPLFSYTMRELRKWFKVPERLPPKVAKAKSTGKVPKRLSGLLALAQKRAEEYLKLEAHRGGFQQGHRHLALYAGAVLLRMLNRPDGELEDEIEALASRCNPPLTRSEWRDTLRDSLVAQGKPRKVRDETLVKWLETTAEETESLDLHHLRFDAKHEPRPAARGQKQRLESRLVALEKIRVELGSEAKVVKVSELQDRLEKEYGFEASRGTVWANAKRVGFDFTREKTTTTDDRQLHLQDAL